MNFETELLPKPKAVCLLSGGLDSCTCLALAIKGGYECEAISFDYGQKHRIELQSAAKIANHYGVKHTIIKAPLDFITTSSLISPSLPIPDQEPSTDIPTTWVPQRNSIFLAYAFSYAEVIGANIVVIGANQVDYSNYPDCREGYLHMMWNALNSGSKQACEGTKTISIIAPLLNSTKADIVRRAVKLNAPIHLTRSCYKGKEKACGVCESCRIRLAAFEEAQEVDPIPYLHIPPEE